MIEITIGVNNETKVSIETESFSEARDFLDRFAVENSRIYFSVIYSKEKAFQILHELEKEFTT